MIDHKKDKTCGKWLAGEDIDRYHSSWSGEWLSYGDWLGAPREPRYFTGPRLLFREIPGNERRIQAAFIVLNGPANRGRDSLYLFMRHWTAGWLRRENLALYKKLPHLFAMGQRLPR